MEAKAIAEGIKENGVEDSDKVVSSVQAQRQQQEMQDLEKRYILQKKVLVDSALENLAQKHDILREELAKKQHAELDALQVG